MAPAHVPASLSRQQLATQLENKADLEHKRGEMVTGKELRERSKLLPVQLSRPTLHLSKLPAAPGEPSCV